MAGIVYLLPNRIAQGPVQQSLPEGTLARARACTLFFAENAKSARSYLKALEHPSPISSLDIVEIGHAPDAAQFETWLAPVAAGRDAAIVSESGCPGVADPGAGLVACASRLGIRIVPLVGPCSILLTLMASGMDGQRFRFLGYLPVKEDELTPAVHALENASRAPETQLFIETPYRNNRLLTTLTQLLGEHTLITVATDVTGEAEKIRTLSAGQWKAHLGSLPKLPTVFAVLAKKRSRD